MISSLLHNYAFNLEFARKLVDDIPDEQLAEQPSGVVNHPAWILGHLVIASDFAALLLDQPPPPREGWMEKFGRQSAPSAERAQYPSKAELVAALEEVHQRVTAALEQAHPSLLDRQPPDDEFAQFMPTVGDGLLFLMAAHEATHLGQLAVWRKATGRPRVLG